MASINQEFEEDIRKIGNSFIEKLVIIEKKFQELEGNKEISPSNQIQFGTDDSHTVIMMGGLYYWTDEDSTFRTASDNIWLFDFKRSIMRKTDLVMPFPGLAVGSVFLNGELYIFGGSDAKSTLCNLYKFIAKDCKWKELACMRWSFSSSIIANTSVVLDDCIWIVEGKGKDMIKYDPKEDKWIEMPSMQEYRIYPTVAAINGKIFVCGGKESKTVEFFDPKTNSWQFFTSLPDVRFGSSALGIGSELYIFGGRRPQLENESEDNTITKSVWKINAEENNATWEELPEMEQGRVFSKAVNLGGKMAILGGLELAVDKNVEVFDGKKWSIGPLEAWRKCHVSATLIPEELATRIYAHLPAGKYFNYGSPY